MGWDFGNHSVWREIWITEDRDKGVYTVFVFSAPIYLFYYLFLSFTDTAGIYYIIYWSISLFVIKMLPSFQRSACLNKQKFTGILTVW